MSTRQHSVSSSSPGEGNAGSASTSRTARYGSSCVACRRRKQRCDAKTPACSRCVKLKEECVYEGNIRNQPSPHLVPLLVKTFDFLRSVVSPHSPHSDTDIRPLIRQFLDDNQVLSFTARNKSIGGANDPEHGDPAAAKEREISRDAVDETIGIAEEDIGEGNSEVDELLMHMSLADDGQNGHFGITSLFYQTPSESVVERLQRRLSRSQGPSRHALQRSTSNQTDRNADSVLNYSQRKDSDDEIWATDEQSMSTGPEDEAGILKANASMLGGWENLAYSKLELETDASSAKMTVHLLKTYFCWQYGSHCVVYRPVFIRDMALGGPYFNHFLLNVICAHATRYSDYHQQMGSLNGGNTNGLSTPALTLGADYMNRAKILLAAEMDKFNQNIPSSDLAIHLDCNRLPIFGFGTMSAEDREIRRRLFWSAYTWDKIISLALGRTPTFNAWQNASPGPIVDDTEDDSEWKPYFWDDVTPPELADYPVQRSLMTSNFRHFIKLCEIIQKIIMRLYNGRVTRLRSHNFVEHMKQRLIEWMDQLPAGLKIVVDDLPEHCPPPHIFSTKIYLPNAVPVRTAAPASITESAATHCTLMAEELHKLFTLYSKTFKLRNMTYTLSWSMYSAATINAMDFQSSNPTVAAAAGPRLSMSLHVLERSSLQTPGIQRSIEIIKQRLRSPAIRAPKRPVETPYNVDRIKRIQPIQEDPSDLLQIQEPQTTGSVQSEPVVMATEASSEYDLTNLIEASLTDSHPPQSNDDDEVFNMWNNMIQHGVGGAGNMDLLQGMMAMPSVIAAPSQYPAYNEWSSDWWAQSDS